MVMENRKTKIISAVAKKRRIAAAVTLLLMNERRIHRWWVHPINQKRQQQGDWNNLIQEMRLYDEDKFFNFTRLTVPQFDFLLSLVGTKIRKINTFRIPIPPGARLAITLRFLATGDSLASIAYAFRVGKATAHKIIKETCEALWEVLCPKYLKFPNETGWKRIAEEYENIWNLPHCVGSIDGKHVVIQAPKHSGSKYFSYKKSFSIVLFGICDANYLFTYVDIGAYGSQSDGGVLRESSFGSKFFKNELDLPADSNITNTNIVMPYYFVGDAAFPLYKNLLRPYGGSNLTNDKRIFNYRLSRAQRCIENAFGILVARFRIFHRTINAHPDTVDVIVKATVCLHNFIKSTGGNKYSPGNYVDRYDTEGNIIPGEWRQDVPRNSALANIRQLSRRLGSRNASRTAEYYRTTLKDYVNSAVGAVPWQDAII